MNVSMWHSTKKNKQTKKKSSFYVRPREGDNFSKGRNKDGVASWICNMSKGGKTEGLENTEKSNRIETSRVL